jgi:hypothetical protein
MRYDRTVIAYHGCDARVADRLLAGEPFRKSRNDFDWLGEGVYFWPLGKSATTARCSSPRSNASVARCVTERPG